MQTINTAILDSIEQDGSQAARQSQAQREKAVETYWTTLLDASRTSPKDKAVMAAAMKVLGKSTDDANADVMAIETARQLGRLKDESHAALTALKKAEADALEYTSVTCPANHKKMLDTFRANSEEIARRGSDHSAAAQALKDSISFLKQHADAVEAMERHSPK